MRGDRALGFQWQIETCVGWARHAVPLRIEEHSEPEWGARNEKRALTDRPSELNHFDDTLAVSLTPTPANHQGTQANEKGGWCKPPLSN